MRRAHKFLALAPVERRLLVEAVLLVGAARLALWLLPFRALPGMLENLARLIVKRGSTPVSPERIGWAMAVVSSYIPAATCLAQALAAQALLRQRGCPAQLRIGVAKGENGQLEAHAWLDVEGQALVGGSIHSRYTALPTIEGRLL